jgi:nitric oxide reductase NorQ protein
MGTVQDAQSALLGVHTLNKDGVSEFKHAPFVSHIQSGGIVLLDELSRAPLAANNILFPCLDNRRYLPVDVAHDEKDQKIMVNDATVFIATANIGNEYSGTNALDRALLDRFFPIETQYPQENDEIKVLITRTGIEENEAKAIVKVANEVRKQYRDQELSSSISVRHTLQTAGLVVDGFDLTNALQAVVMPLFDDGIGASERAKVKSIIAAF